MTTDFDPPSDGFDKPVPAQEPPPSPSPSQESEEPEKNEAASEPRAQEQEYLLLHKSSWPQELAAALLLIFFLALWRFDALVMLNTHFLGGSHADAGLYLWLFRLNLNHFADLGWFQTPAFAPYSLGLAWSDNFILPAWVMKPLSYLGVEWQILYNLSILAAQFLNGYLTYRLAYLLSGTFLQSLCAGIIFTGLAFFTLNLGHPQLQFAFYFPAAVICLLYFFRTPSLWYGLAFGLLVFLSFLTTVYYSLFLILLPVVFFSTAKALRPTTLYPVTLLQFFVGAVVGFLPTLPFIIPYLHVKELFGVRQLYEAFAFRAQPWSYLSTSPLSLLYGWTSELSHAEAYLFPGLLLLSLSLLPTVYRLTQARPLQLRAGAVCLLFLAAAVFPEAGQISSEAEFWFGLTAALCQLFCLYHLMRFFRELGRLEASLGVTLFSNRALLCCFLSLALFFFFVSQGPLTGEGFVPSVFQLLYYVVPGFDAMRAIGRAGVLVLFSLTILTFLSFPILLGKRLAWHSTVPLLLTTFILFENFVYPYALEPRDGAPVVLQEINKDIQPNDLAVIIPFTEELTERGTVNSWRDYAWHNVNYMNWSLDYNFQIMNGYSGHRTDVMLELPRKMSGFPDRRSLNTLSYYPGLRYIVVNTNLIKDRTPEQILIEANNFLDELEYIASDGEGYLLFEANPRTRLRDTFHLRVPSSPRRYLSFELVREYVPDAEPIQVRVIEHDHRNGGAVVPLSVSSNGEWQQFVFELPAPLNPAMPFRMSFDIPDDETLYIRNAHLLNPSQLEADQNG